MFTNASLLLRDLQREDTGMYTCKQYNSHNNQGLLDEKTLVLLEANFPQSPVEEGKEADLKCWLVCDENNDPCKLNLESPDLKWTNDTGKGVRPQPGRYTVNNDGPFFTNLRIKVIRSDHNRHWRCEFSVNNHVKISQEYTLTVKGAGDAVYSTLRQSVLLPCHEKPESSSQRVQWKFEGESNQISPLAVLYPNGTVTKLAPSSDHSRINLFPNASLYLQGLQRKDPGIYTCVTYNVYNKEVTLREVSLILLTVQLIPKGPAISGTEVTLHCTMLCGRTELQCLSSHKDVELSWQDDTGHTLSAINSSSATPQAWNNAKITVQKSDHLRKWTCNLSVRNQIRASQQYTMNVKDSQVQVLFVPEGRSAEFSGIDTSDLESSDQLNCFFQRIGASEYQKLAIIPSSEPVNCAECDFPPRLHLLPSTSLLLQGTRAADTGSYKCSKNNDNLVWIFNLSVLSVVGNVNGSVKEGSNVTLNCSVTYLAPFSSVIFSWTDPQGNPVRQGATRMIVKNKKFSQLTITNVHHPDSEGMWKCSLEVNGMMKTQQEYHLQVTDSTLGAGYEWLEYVLLVVLGGKGLILILIVTIFCLTK